MYFFIFLTLTLSLTLTLNGKDCTGSTLDEILASCEETYDSVQTLYVKEGGMIDPKTIGDKFKHLTVLNMPKSSFSGIIPQSQFENYQSLTEVNISGATMIDSFAFRSCPNLKTAIFDSCTKIDRAAFANCPNLENISFPVLDEIGIEVFQNTGLVNVELDSVTKIENPNNGYGEAFEGCGKLTHISMKNADAISNHMFVDCHQLIYADFPKATLISIYAFQGCQSFSNLTFPSVKYIQQHAFNGLQSITEIYFPSVIEIGSSVFESCKNLKKATFPQCTKIYSKGFMNCANLETIIFPVLRDIEMDAFQNTGLIRVELDSVTDVCNSGNSYYEDHFRGCGKLTHISMKNANRITRRMFGDCIQLTYVNFPACTQVFENGFENCRNIQIFNVGLSSVQTDFLPNPLQLRQISFPNAVSVTNANIINLKNLVFCSLESVALIESETFANLNNLVELELPKVTELEPNAFIGCNSLSSISLKSLSIVDTNSSEIFNGCPYLKKLYFPENPPRTFHQDTFKNKNCRLIIPTASISIYDDDTSVEGDEANDGFWCGLRLPTKGLSIIINGNDNETFSGQQLSDCIKQSGISESLITILEITDGTLKMSSLIDSVNQLPNLDEFIISEFVKIEDEFTAEMFKDSSFSSIKIDVPLEKIPSNCFKGCTKLKTVTITNCKEVEGSAFSGCSNLIMVSLSAEKLTGDSHFEGCTSLYSVSMTSLKTVDPTSEKIFADCPLTTLYFPPTPPGIFHPKTFEGKNITFPQLTSSELKNYDSNTEVEGDVSGDYKWCGIDLIQQYIEVSINDNEYIFSESISAAIATSSVSDVIKISIKGGLVRDTTLNEIKGITSLKSLDILETAVLESYIISSEQFKDLTNLNHVSIMHNISLSEKCFMGCTSLINATFGSANLISDSCFKGCTNLYRLIIPNCKTLKGDYIFSNCKYLQEIDLSSLEYVDQTSAHNFDGCTNLINLYLPSKEPSTFNENSFKDCSNLRITLPFEEDYIQYDDNSKIKDDIPEDSRWCRANLNENNSTKSLYFRFNNAYYRKRSIKNVPVNKPSSSLNILQDPFDLIYLELIDGLFDKYELKYFISSSSTLETFVAQPSTLEGLIKETFTGCTKLKEINIESNAVFDTGLFKNLPSLTTLSVPMLRTLVSDDFEGDKNLQEISLPSVISVPKNAFASLDKLTKLNLKSANSLFDGCFKNCILLESIELPSVTSIFGDSHFNGCTSLKSIDLNSLETVPSDASLIFGGCSKLESLALPNEPPKIFNENVFTNAGTVPKIKLNDENAWENYHKQCTFDKDTNTYVWYGYNTNSKKEEGGGEKEDKPGVSIGVLAGAIIGSIIGSALITFLITFLVLRCKYRIGDKSLNQDVP